MLRFASRCSLDCGRQNGGLDGFRDERGFAAASSEGQQGWWGFDGAGFRMPRRLTIAMQRENPDTLLLLVDGHQRPFIQIGRVGAEGLDQPRSERLWERIEGADLNYTGTLFLSERQQDAEIEIVREYHITMNSCPIHD
jgi:hypothetical protein